jgi:hypothetical protein
LAASGETKGVRRTSGVSPDAGRCAFNGPIATPDPEGPEKKKRRKFTAAEKLSIVPQAGKLIMLWKSELLPIIEKHFILTRTGVFQ